MPAGIVGAGIAFSRFLSNPLVPIRPFLFLVALLSASFGFAQSPRTIAQSAAKAMLVFPEVRSAAANWRATERAQAVARGAYLPSVDLNLGRGNETSDNATTRATGREVTLQRREAEITLSQLDKLGLDSVDLLALKQAGLVGEIAKVVKVIKSGALTKAVKLNGIGATAGAKAAIEAAGGSLA